MTAEDPFLPMQRQMVVILAGQRVRQQTGTGLTAGDRLWRLRGHDHVLFERIIAGHDPLFTTSVLLLPMHDQWLQELRIIRQFGGIHFEFGVRAHGNTATRELANR